LYQSSFLSYNPTTGNPCYTAAVIAICVPAREIANQANIPEPGDGSSLFFSKKKKTDAQRNFEQQSECGDSIGELRDSQQSFQKEFLVFSIEWLLLMGPPD